MDQQDNPLIRIKKLCELSGVTRATVKYYIAKGLIPKPIKSSRNMAYYDQTHLDAIRVVKQLQTKRFFPLSVIQGILEKDVEDLTIDEKRTLAEVEGKFFLNRETEQLGPFTVQQLHEFTGVSLIDIRAMERDGVIQSFKKDGKKFFRDDNIRLVMCWREIRLLGFSPEIGYDTYMMKLYKDTFERLTDEETKIASKRLIKLPREQGIKMIEDIMAPLNTIFGILHRRCVLETVEKYAKQFRDQS